MAESPDDDPDGPSTTRGPSRRRVLQVAGGGVLGAGVARVVYELLGFGHVTGTNLLDQRLAPVARRRLGPSPFDLTLRGYRLRFDGETAVVDEAGDAVATVPVAGTDPAAAARAGAQHDLGAPLARLVADLDAVRAGEFSVEFSGYEAFFDRLRDAETRPLTVAALRGARYRRPPPSSVRRFTGADLDEPASLVAGLAAGFAEHTRFDGARYAAEAVQDHVFGGTVSLDGPFEEATTFDAILDGTSGLYCYEYTLRSVEAFHAVAPHRQSPPVLGGIVFDRRHNHVYTALASVVRDDGRLCVPMTFLDFSHSTMYDTYRLRWALGEGVDAYDRRHRATVIHYRNRYAR